MNHSKQALYTIIHGHFYQPAREDPWIGEIERQKGAAPYHDWNELITHQCYLPNGSARVVDGGGRITDIVNNYAYISFNVGPTLFSWLEQKFPWVIDSMLKADSESMTRNGGHGNAIAQVYNHVIMPLANERDKRTQAKWGIRYFEKKFARLPESLWLPETAVDYATAKILGDLGMKFMVLAPHQALRIRPLDRGGRGSWQDVSDGGIDTRRAYRLFLKDGRGERSAGSFIDVFFRHAELSRAVAFDRTFQDSAICAERIAAILGQSKECPLLANIATDGETYGHHHPFRDMSLAYLVKYELPQKGIQVVNYARYLELCPPVWEVELNEGKDGEGTSWSCPHGVERWRADCGCNTGTHAGWHQKWRAPLKESLDWLRDSLIEVFEQRGGILFKDPWQARDDYIEVVMDRSADCITHFMQAHLKVELTSPHKVKALKLLEMQRFAMLMYASCGWFFDELSGVEPVQNLRCAARAMQLAGEVGAGNLEQEFMDRLSAAKSNVPEFGDGGRIYHELVQPFVHSWQRTCASFLISQCVIGESPASASQYQFQMKDVDERADSGVMRRAGRVRLISIPTEEVQEAPFFLIHFGEYRVSCFIDSAVDDGQHPELHSRFLQGDIDPGQERVELTVSPLLGTAYTIGDMFPGEREKVFSYVMNKRIEGLYKANEPFFKQDLVLMRELAETGWHLPPDVLFIVAACVTYRIRREVYLFEQDGDIDHFSQIRDLKELSNELSISPDMSFLVGAVAKKAQEEAKALNQSLNKRTVQMLRGLNQGMASLDLQYRKHEVQNELWLVMQRILSQYDKLTLPIELKSWLTDFLLLVDDFGFDISSLTKRLSSGE